jgi:hypothetical protein
LTSKLFFGFAEVPGLHRYPLTAPQHALRAAGCARSIAIIAARVYRCLRPKGRLMHEQATLPETLFFGYYRKYNLRIRVALIFNNQLIGCRIAGRRFCSMRRISGSCARCGT